MGQFVAEVGGLLNSNAYFVKPRPEDPVDERTNASHINGILTQLVLVNLEPDLLKDALQMWESRVLEGMDINPYINEKGLRASLNLSEDSSLPEFPRFQNYEVWVQVVPTGEKPKFNDLVGLRDFTQTLLDRSRSETFKIQLRIYHGMSFVGPQTMQTTISQLTEKSVDILQEISTAYQSSWPFIYQIYREYYDTSDQQTPASFVEFLRDHPSVIELKDINKLFAPFAEHSIYVSVFKQYKKYKACIEDFVFCEQSGEKEAFIQLINDLLTEEAKKK